LFRRGSEREPNPPASMTPKGAPIRAVSEFNPLESIVQIPLHVLVIFGMMGKGPGVGRGFFEAVVTGVACACRGIMSGQERISRTVPPKAIFPVALIAGTPSEV
jgi:hypothetical protein